MNHIFSHSPHVLSFVLYEPHLLSLTLHTCCRSCYMYLLSPTLVTCFTLHFSFASTCIWYRWKLCLKLLTVVKFKYAYDLNNTSIAFLNPNKCIYFTYIFKCDFLKTPKMRLIGLWKKGDV